MTVDITDGDALAPIYSDKGGFRKPLFYGNFDIDGHKSIFSEIVPENRAIRAKAVVPIFSMGNLRAGRGVFYECVDLWVQRMKQMQKSSEGKPVNVLELTRGLAVDVVTEYLFGRRFGGLDAEQHGQDADGMKASGMVNSFVAVGRYWYLPGWVFQWVEWLEGRFWPDHEAASSMEAVDDFVAGVVDEANEQREKGESTYQVRLLDAGLSVSETRAQCKDLIFAGTDSTGMNLATICFMLVKYPEKYEKLKQEVIESKSTEDEVLLLSYLRAVVSEGLRLAMANPSRLPRVVPGEGWTFKGTYFPGGTEVSCTPFELHLNGDIFDNPNEFRPERWLDANDEMRRDQIAFGLGPRQCIARNLASQELHCAVQRIAEEGVLDGARCCKEKIEILEWFNSKAVGGSLDLVWD